jgi:prepilin-type N-terminal cleavage/methylation domain-containing protein
VRTESGFTLLEVVLVLATIGVLAAVAIPVTGRLLDGIRVRAAAGEAYALFGARRQLAILHGRMTTVEVDTLRRRITVRSNAETLRSRPLGEIHGVRLHATRPATVYAPNGLGYGLSNLTLVIRRGRAADTLTVSRLGRVRR